MKKFNGTILACDMDGTLLDSDRQISRQNREAISYYVEEGGRFSIATGRTYYAATDYIASLPVNAPCSMLNGSVVFDGEQCIYCAGMPEGTKQLIEKILTNFSQIACEIFHQKDILIRRMGEVTEHHMRILNLQYQMIDDLQPEDTCNWGKINFTGVVDEIQRLRQFVKPYENAFCFAASAPTFCEVTTRGVDKGAALRRIADICSISANNIFAIGDSENDEALLKSAHLSFAPQNALEGIRSMADITVSSNDDNAVADAITWLDQHL